MLLEWNLYGRLLAGLLWERQFEKVLLEKWMGDSANLEMSVCASSGRSIPFRVRGSHQNCKEEAQSVIHVKKIDETRRSWRNLRRFLTKFTWDALNVNVRRTIISSTSSGKCSNHEFPQEKQRS